MVRNIIENPLTSLLYYKNLLRNNQEEINVKSRPKYPHWLGYKFVNGDHTLVYFLNAFAPIFLSCGSNRK